MCICVYPVDVQCADVVRYADVVMLPETAVGKDERTVFTGGKYVFGGVIDGYVAMTRVSIVPIGRNMKILAMILKKGEVVIMKNEWTKKMENVKPCPFCGSISISAKHKDCGIYLYNSFNKILKMKVYCYCNKCHARSKPISYLGRQYGDAEKYEIGIYDDRMKEKALEKWNERS